MSPEREPGLERVVLHHVAVPLLVPLEAAHGREAVRSVVVVEVVGTDGSRGWGECDALSRPGYTAEYTAGALAVLAEHLVPAVLAAPDEPARRASLVGPGHAMARAALRDALLDRGLRARGCPLAAHLGAVRPVLERTVVLGCGGGPDAVVARAEAAQRSGARMVKVKVAGPGDVAALRAVRATFPALMLAADLNGSARGAGPGDLAWADELGLTYLEQPDAAEALVATARLARTLGTPIALDESIDSPDAAATAWALGALGVLNVKPARVGGVEAASALADWAAEHGVAAFCGGMIELGLGRATATAVAALDACTLPTDLGPSAAYVAVELTEPVVLDDAGRLVVPSGPGAGVTPRSDTLAAATVERRVVSR